MHSSIAQNLRTIRLTIEESARSCGRRASDIRLIAVSKTQPIERIHEAYRAGLRIFAENKVQELQAKFAPCPQADIELPTIDLVNGEMLGIERHFIGHLQSNKARKAVQIADWIQSVDSEGILRRIGSEAEKIGKKMNICIEVNTAEDDSKFGLRSEDDVFSLIESAQALPAVELRGLMTIGPLRSEGEGRLRSAFVSLRELFEACGERFAPANWDSLSMGMSNDYDLAIAEGATMLRIGTALFGQRSEAQRSEHGGL